MIAAGAALCLTVPCAWAQTLGQGGGDDISLGRILAALVFCLLVVVAAAYVLRFRPGIVAFLSLAKPGSRRLRVMETVSLGRHVNLCIVTCDSQELLVSVSMQGAQLLDRLPRDAAAGRDGR